MLEDQNAIQPNGLAIKMFQKFARFEYALKASGFYVNSEPRNGVFKATPDWVGFGCSISEDLEHPKTVSLEKAICYISDNPPMQHVVTADGYLDWGVTRKTAPCPSAVILLHICQVRNNLFHGGKLDWNGNWFPEHAERSELLIKHSLTILEGCLEACQKVKTAYGQ